MAMWIVKNENAYECLKDAITGSLFWHSACDSYWEASDKMDMECTFNNVVGICDTYQYGNILLQ